MIPVKICGITCAEDAHLAAKSGASAIGLIFYKQSPRYVNVETAKTIVKGLAEVVAKVGVFVNERLETINAIAKAVNLDFIQLHGTESPNFCNFIERPVIKAIRVGDHFDEGSITGYQVDAFLLDTYRRGLPGGTGKPFDWELVNHSRLSRPVILAGGLTPENVLTGIQAVNPAAIDVNSGVEAYPGRKDPDKVKAIFKKVSTTGDYENIFIRPREKMIKNNRNY